MSITRPLAIFFVASVVALPGYVRAEPAPGNIEIEVGLTACAELDSNLRRLECYDGLAEGIIQASPRAAAPQLGRSVEPVSAVGSEVASVPAAGPIEIESRREVTRAKGRKLRPRLVAECGANPKASIVLGVILPPGMVPVNTRIDDGEIIKETWSVGADKGRLNVPRAAQFFAAIHKGKVLEVKVSPPKGAPIPFSFDLEPLKAVCR